MRLIKLEDGSFYANINLKYTITTLNRSTPDFETRVGNIHVVNPGD